MRALLSVANRDGIVALARDLLDLGHRGLRHRRDPRLPRRRGRRPSPPSPTLTQGEPDVGGQVKTFHHAVYAGILARRDVPAQLEELRGAGDRPHRHRRRQRQAVRAGHRGQARRPRRGDRDDRRRRRGAPRGGRPQCGRGRRRSRIPPTTRRSSRSCASSGVVSPETRAKLAAEAFSTVAAYHAEIAAYLNQISGNTFPRHLALVLEKVDDLRYGENPHQRAAFYRETTHRSGTLADATRLQGDMPSFNNLLDLDAAYRIARDYTSPTVAIVKHTDPVGLASHDELVEAYRHALETDPVAAFGGIVGVNRELDGATAREIAANSYEAVVAPGLQPGGASASCAASPASSCWPSRPTRPRGCATTASPASTSSGSPAACSSRAWTSSASIAAGSRS